MSALLDSLTQTALLPVALGLLCLAVIVLAAANVRAERRWAALMRATDGRNLESILQAHLAERERQEAEIESLGARVRHVEEKARNAKRHIGLLRFDAFDEIGGHQSFAVALVDARGDGLVLSTIVGRETARTFAKAIVGGRSELELSGEERRALREAMGDAPRAVVGG